MHNFIDANCSNEIRCPVHGFIYLNEWELAIVDQPVFQRLRRIRQLAWTDYVYPGAMHTRFEHSLGVLHVATLLYDAVVRNSYDVLEADLAYNKDGLGRHRQLVRLAALLHDVGHGPFSHASEELLPIREGTQNKYKHEQYSAAIIRNCLRDVIENHPHNSNYGFTADEVAALLEGSSQAKHAIFWRELIDSQLDADRIDYLLRDSHHVGVKYGSFDLERLVSTLVAIPGFDRRGPRLGISEGGWHAAEGLVTARYAMFTQVYFHKTRIAYNIHLREALQNLLPNGQFPPPARNHIDEFLKWDDWRVLGLLASGEGGEHGRRLANREHYREAFHTAERPDQIGLDEFEKVAAALGDLVASIEDAQRAWYKTGPADIEVLSETRANHVEPLSKHSDIVRNLRAIGQRRLYVRRESYQEAQRIKNLVLGGDHG